MKVKIFGVTSSLWEFLGNLIGAALFVVVIWVYTVMFTLLFAAE